MFLDPFEAESNILLLKTCHFPKFWLHEYNNGLKFKFLHLIFVVHDFIVHFHLYFTFIRVHLVWFGKSFVKTMGVGPILAIFNKMAPPWIPTMSSSWP